jgi:hypothetical protein
MLHTQHSVLHFACQISMCQVVSAANAQIYFPSFIGYSAAGIALHGRLVGLLLHLQHGECTVT